MWGFIPWQSAINLLELVIMPEGPEVKTVARTLGENLSGKRLGALWHSELQLRHAVDYRRIRAFEHHVVDNVSCYGKILFIDIDQKPALLAQLGMTGQLTVVKTRAPVAPHTHIRWLLPDSDEELRYVDPRRFGLFDACNAQEKQAHIARLGPDPFSISMREKKQLTEVMRKSTRAIKEILLDQTVLVGVGNIYASEALFRANIHPLRLGVDITTQEYARLINAVIEILHLAYKNCGTTFSNYVDGSGKRGQNITYLKVFQRDKSPCPTCAVPIERIKQNGRSTFFCPRCQS